MTYCYPNIETIRLARAKVHKLFADGKLKCSLNWILKIDTEECQGEKCIDNFPGERARGSCKTNTITMGVMMIHCWLVGFWGGMYLLVSNHGSRITSCEG